MSVAVHVRPGVAVVPARATPATRTRVHPLRTALAIGGTNLVASVLWIVTSSALAARLAGSVDELQRMEQAKGLVFVAGMSLLLCGTTWVLLRRVERQQALLEQQREALAVSEARALAGVVASAAAHDMNNVVVMAAGQLELLAMDGVRSARVEAVSRALDRLAELARKMQSFGRGALPQEPVRLDLAGAVRDSLELVSRHPDVASCEVRLELPASLPFVGHELLVARIVTNLVLNAAEAARGASAPADPASPRRPTRDGGRILVRLHGDSQRAVLEVHDDGPGVPVERRQSIMEPFQTTKRRGIGLGLVSVRGAAQEHGGDVEIADSALGGACFRVVLPAARAEAAG